jgi:hypothetical protein
MNAKQRTSMQTIATRRRTGLGADLGILVIVAQAMAQPVSQWSVHEISPQAEREYGNAYTDVVLTATFRGPGGITMLCPAFGTTGGYTACGSRRRIRACGLAPRPLSRRMQGLPLQAGWRSGYLVPERTASSAGMCDSQRVLRSMTARAFWSMAEFRGTRSKECVWRGWAIRRSRPRLESGVFQRRSRLETCPCPPLGQVNNGLARLKRRWKTPLSKRGRDVQYTTSSRRLPTSSEICHEPYLNPEPKCISLCL